MAYIHEFSNEGWIFKWITTDLFLLKTFNLDMILVVKWVGRGGRKPALGVVKNHWPFLLLWFIQRSENISYFSVSATRTAVPNLRVPVCGAECPALHLNSTPFTGRILNPVWHVCKGSTNPGHVIFHFHFQAQNRARGVGGENGIFSSPLSLPLPSLPSLLGLQGRQSLYSLAGED